MEENKLPVQQYIFEETTSFPLSELAFEPFLYFKPEHLQLQPNTSLTFFLFRNSKSGKIEALFPVFFENAQVFSPYRGPFSGIQFSVDLPAQALYDFVAQTENAFREKGIQNLNLTTFPGAYQPQQAALLTHVLLQHNFLVQYSQLNHHIPVSGSDFEDIIHTSAKRRLKKSEQAGFKVQQEKPEMLNEIYHQITVWRTQKNIPVTLSLPQLQELLTRFPDDFLIFSVKTGSDIIAATVAIKVSYNILYTYLPASNPEWNTFSPVILLNEYLYNYCRQQQISIFDLGISSVPEKENWPLIKFKERLGAKASQKLTFTKSLF